MEVFVKKGNPPRFLARMSSEDVRALTLALAYRTLWFEVVADAEGAWVPSDRQAFADLLSDLQAALKHPKEIE